MEWSLDRDTELDYAVIDKSDQWSEVSMQNELFAITLQNKLAPDQMLILRVH